MKKLSNRKKGVIGFIVVLFAVGYFAKEYYFEKLLRENLPVKFQSSEVSIFMKKISLDKVLYENQNEKTIDTYSMDKIQTQIDSVDFQKKEVVIEKIDIDGFAFNRGEKIPGYGVLPESPKGEGKSLSVTKVESQQSKVQSTEVQKEQPKKKKSKNFFKQLIGVVEEGLGTGTVAISDLLNEKWLQEKIDGAISKYLEENIHKYAIDGDEALKFIEKRKNEELAATDSWSVKIKEVEATTVVFQEEIAGSIKNISNKISTMESPVTFEFFNKNRMNNMNGTVFIPNLTGEIQLDFKDFNYKAIEGSEKYLSSAKVGIVHKSIYNEGYEEARGVIIINDATLNSNQIVEELSKNNNVSSDSKEMKVLRYALTKVNSVKIQYSYNTKTRKVMVQTDIVEQIKNIVKKNFFQIIEEVIK